MCPGGVVEVTAAAAPSWNKVLPGSSSPVGARLRRRQRACGGRSPCVGDLYRSWSAVARRPRWRWPLRLLPCSAGVLPRRLQRSWDIFCKDATAAVGLTDGWRVDRARVSPDDGRRRALVQGRRSLGRGPGRWAIGDAFISSVRVSVYFDSSQSLVPMELRRSWGRRRAGDGVRRAAGEIALWRIRDAEGPRGLFVIFLFLRDLSAKQLSSVSFLNVSVFVWVFVWYP